MGDAGFTFSTPRSSISGIRPPSIATSSRSRRSQASSTRSSHTNRSDKTLRDLVGNWMLNPSLSTPPNPTTSTSFLENPNGVFSLSNLAITQSHYPSQIFVKSTSITERWFPPQRPGEWSSWNRSFEGTRSRCRWVRGDQFEDRKDGIAFLTYGLARLGEFFEAEVEGKDGEWKMGQVWFVQRGCQLVRRFVRVDKDEGEEKRREGEEVWEFVGR
ncbi:hypothetical protein AC578_7876 [Pseudocercospora eumusae]|uniref:Uncharacterized protein n=1 Tax=Pseudocercospora eumusae TaxID=321146 RepID=A0A139H0B5_9PEZI|nr:hypothetical protein AC578_7876 [Pseudocercospora eumusae]